LGREAKPISLMDLATVCARYFHKTGKLENLVVSDEINACTIEIEAEFDGKKEPWYLFSKTKRTITLQKLNLLVVLLLVWVAQSEILCLVELLCSKRCV
jgi:hypothetical protein